jgi:uncharacterized protein (DUF1778 family)
MAAAQLDAREKINLSPADWDTFYDALINPPAPGSPRRW